MELKGTILRSRQFTRNRHGQTKHFPFAGGTVTLAGPWRTGPKGGKYLDAEVVVERNGRRQVGRARVYESSVGMMAAGINSPLFVKWRNGQTHCVGTVKLESVRK